MKKLFSLGYLMFVIASVGIAQKYYSYGNIQSAVANGANFNVTISNYVGGFRPYPQTYFEETDLTATNTVVWASCGRFPIVAIVSAVPLVLTLSDPMATGFFAGPDCIGERLGVTQETVTSDGVAIAGFMNVADGNAGSVDGIFPSYLACSQHYYAENIKQAIGAITPLHESISTSKTYTSANLPSAIEVDATTATVTIDLPVTALSKKVTIYRKNTDNSSNPINVNVGGTLYKVMYNQIMVEFVNTNSIWSAKL